MKAPIPENEEERQQSLDDLKILDTPAEERFDRITRMALRFLGVPISTITMVDSDRHWSKSTAGLDVIEVPRAISFCSHAILTDEPTVVFDSREDERFQDSPVVVNPPCIRFYAAYPLTTDEGFRVGTMCIIDTEPKDPDAVDLATLGDLAALAETELRVARLSEEQLRLIAELNAAQRKAAVDPLTRLWNRGTIFELLKRELARGKRNKISTAVIMVDVDHFKTINDTKGHPVGDQVLREVATRIRGSVREYDGVGRYGGEEFMVVLTDVSEAVVKRVAEEIRISIAKSPIIVNGNSIPVTASLGFAVGDVVKSCNSDSLVEAADKALYRAKKAGRNRSESAG